MSEREREGENRLDLAKVTAKGLRQRACVKESEGVVLSLLGIEWFSCQSER